MENCIQVQRSVQLPGCDYEGPVSLVNMRGLVKEVKG